MAPVQGSCLPAHDSDSDDCVLIETEIATPPSFIKVFRFNVADRQPDSFFYQICPLNLCGLHCLEWICRRAGVGEGQWTINSIAEALDVPYQQPGFRGMTGSQLMAFAEQHLREITIIEYVADACPSDTQPAPAQPGHTLPSSREDEPWEN